MQESGSECSDPCKYLRCDWPVSLTQPRLHAIAFLESLGWMLKVFCFWGFFAGWVTGSGRIH